MLGTNTARVGTWAAIGALAVHATTAHSAVVTYAGVHGYYADVTSAEPPEYTPAPFTTGSVNLELDRNGDGVDGDVALVSASFSSSLTTSFGAQGFLVRDDSLTVAGGVGTLAGAEILWASGGTQVLSHSRTLFCSGSICAALGLPEGPVPPEVGIPEGRFGQPPDLGRWALSGDLSQILGSTRAVFTVGGLTPPPALGEPAEWFVLGDTDLGFVPEPGAAALLLVALGALAARQRAATAR